MPGAQGPVRMARRRARAHRVRQRRGRGPQATVRAGASDPPVPGVPGALWVLVRVLQPVFGPREGRRRGQGRRRAAQAVRAATLGLEHRGVQLQAARQVPRTGGQGPLPQGREGGRPVRRGSQGLASLACETVRRGQVGTHEGRQVRQSHRRGETPVFHRSGQRGM